MGFCLNLLTSEPKPNTNSKPRLPFLKPKPSTGSAFCPVSSKVVSYDSGKRASICSQEVCRTMTEFKHTLNDSVAAQMLIESTKKGRPQSPVPDDKGQDFTSAEIPHEVRSLLPQKNNMRSVSPNQLVIFPPEIPSQYRNYRKSPTPEPKNKTKVTVEPVFTNTFKINSRAGNLNFQDSDVYSERAELKYLPKFCGIKGPMSLAMEIAPDRPFSPIAVTEPIIKPTPWISLPIDNENRPESPLVAALKTAPERSYSPLPTFVYASDIAPTLTDTIEEVKKTNSVIETSTLNQNLNCKTFSIRPIGNNPVRYLHGYNNTISAISSKNNKLLSQPFSEINSQKRQELKLLSPSCNESLFSGPFKPVESKSNYNETFITHVPNFEKSNTFHSEHLHPTSNKNLPSNYFQDQQHNISNSQWLSESEGRSSISRSIGPGIKNKVSTFSPNTSISDTLYLKKPTSNYCQVNLDKQSTSMVDDSYTFKTNHPNAIKLTKAVPFFSNSTPLTYLPNST